MVITSREYDLSLDDLVACYNSTLSSLIKSHAPLQTRTVVSRPRLPWFNDSIKAAIRERRKAERKWRSTKDPNYYSAFKQKRNYARLLMNLQARLKYYNEFIEKNGFDQGRLFRAANSYYPCPVDQMPRWSQITY